MLRLLDDLVGECIAVRALQGDIDRTVLGYHDHLIPRHRRRGVGHPPDVARRGPAGG